MPIEEIRALLPIERSLGSLAYDAMRDHAEDLTRTIKADIESRNFSDAYDRLRHVNFADAARAVEKHGPVYFQSAYLLGASRVHGSLAATPSYSLGRFNPRIMEAVTRVHASIVSDRASALVHKRLTGLIRDAQTDHHEAAFKREDLQITSNRGPLQAPLYVSRNLLNAPDLIAWAKQAGFKTTLPPEEMHVTILYSKRPMDWTAVPRDTAGCSVGPGTLRSVEALGDKGAVCLIFRAPFLKTRHQQFVDAGGSSDYPSYTAHVTITYDIGMDPRGIEPYEGPLEFGPEIFKPIDNDWHAKITEKRDRLRKDETDDLATLLNAAVDSGSKMMASAAANISTTRLVAYGFLSEAAANNVQQARICAILDDRTTYICQALDGRIINVDNSLSKLESVLSTSDPESLKALSPFMTDSEEMGARLSAMSDEEIANIGTPPFHYGCRSTLEMLEPGEEIESAEPPPLPDDDTEFPDYDSATDAPSRDLQITSNIRDDLPDIVDRMVSQGADLSQELIDAAHNAQALSDAELETVLERLGIQDNDLPTLSD